MIVKRQNQMQLEISDMGNLIIEDLDRDGRWEARNTGWITFVENGEKTVCPLGQPEIRELCRGGEMVFTGQGPHPFTVRTVIETLDEGIAIKITDIDTEEDFESLEYPAHLLSFRSGEEDSYLAVPNKQGTVIPGRLDAGFMRYMHNTWANISDIDVTLPFESGTLNMAWFGAKTHASALYVCMETPEDGALHIIGNGVIDDSGKPVDARNGITPGTRVCSLTPVWNSSHGKLGYERSLTVTPVENGYVGMAKAYRNYVKKTGRFVSLKEKIERNPEVEKLIGAPDIKIYVYTNRPDRPYYRSWSEPVLNGYRRVHTTFEEVGEMAEELKQNGIDRALILLGGWNRAGYDREHIDMWPPADAAGGKAALGQAAKKVRELGYVFSLHDNYQDIYLDSPSYDKKYVMKNKDGSEKLGGIWDGGLCRLVCSKKQLELIKKTVEQVMEHTDISSYYLDTITSALLYECWDEEHPLTRAEDRAAKQRVLDYLTNEKGLIAGGEAGIDWAVEYVPFFEGLPGDSVGYFSGVESARFGISAPLFNLVYHDAVICYWQHGQPFGREDHENHVLHDLLSGQPSSWSLVREQWQDLLPLIKQCYEILGRLHRRTAHAEMTNHKFLTPDYMVQESSFEDGTRVMINYGITTYEKEGIRIAPKGFIVDFLGEETIHGSFNRLAAIESNAREEVK